MKLRYLSYCLLFFVFVKAHANITPNSLFSDHMVLQQGVTVPVWGNAAIGERVTIHFNGQTVSTIARKGKWVLSLKKLEAGGPFTMTIIGNDTVQINDIMVGEVWLCSGQSNMEMPMKGFRDQPILGSNEAIFNSDNDQLRLYTVPRSIKLSPQDSSKNSDWKISGPEAVSNFSATAYYFGKMLQQKLHVPVGLVNISYGGTPAEAWMSAEALKSFPEIKVPTAADSATVNWRCFAPTANPGPVAPPPTTPCGCCFPRPRCCAWPGFGLWSKKAS